MRINWEKVGWEATQFDRLQLNLHHRLAMGRACSVIFLQSALHMLLSVKFVINVCTYKGTPPRASCYTCTISLMLRLSTFWISFII